MIKLLHKINKLSTSLHRQIFGVSPGKEAFSLIPVNSNGFWREKFYGL